MHRRKVPTERHRKPEGGLRSWTREVQDGHRCALRIAHEGIEWALRCNEIVEVVEGLLRPVRVGRAGILAAGRVADPNVFVWRSIRIWVRSGAVNPCVATSKRRAEWGELSRYGGRIVSTAMKDKEAAGAARAGGRGRGQRR